MKRRKIGLFVAGAAMLAVTGLSSPNISSTEVDIKVTLLKREAVSTLTLLGLTPYTIIHLFD